MNANDTLQLIVSVIYNQRRGLCRSAHVVLLLLMFHDQLAAQVTGNAGFAARNTVFVDDTFGSDLTGMRERSDLPFKTLNGAITTPLRGAQSGDTIRCVRGVTTRPPAPL